VNPVAFAELAQTVGSMNITMNELAARVVAVMQSQRSSRTPLPEYAKVVAIGKADEVSEVKGHVGVVLDTANDQDGWTYTVYFPAKQETLVLHEQSLWDTGETVPEDVIYGGGETRRVQVDKDGNGTPVA
jgi:hypothetical protein